MSSDCKSKVEMLFSRYTDEQILDFVAWVVTTAKGFVVNELNQNDLDDIEKELIFMRDDSE